MQLSMPVTVIAIVSVVAIAAIVMGSGQLYYLTLSIFW